MNEDCGMIFIGYEELCVFRGKKVFKQKKTYGKTVKIILSFDLGIKTTTDLVNSTMSYLEKEGFLAKEELEQVIFLN